MVSTDVLSEMSADELVMMDALFEAFGEARVDVKIEAPKGTGLRWISFWVNGRIVAKRDVYRLIRWHRFSPDLVWPGRSGAGLVEASTELAVIGDPVRIMTPCCAEMLIAEAYRGRLYCFHCGASSRITNRNPDVAKRVAATAR